MLCVCILKCGLCGAFLNQFSRKSPKGVQKGCSSMHNSFPLPCAGAPGPLGRCFCRRIVTFDHETRGGISLVFHHQRYEALRVRGAQRGQVLQLHDAKQNESGGRNHGVGFLLAIEVLLANQRKKKVDTGAFWFQDQC